jgi:hypothetical protein
MDIMVTEEANVYPMIVSTGKRTARDSMTVSS